MIRSAGALLCSVCLACSTGNRGQGGGAAGVDAGPAAGRGDPASGPASGPDDSGPPATPPSGGGTSPRPDGGPTAPPTTHAYRVVVPEMRGLENPFVVKLSRAGKVLFSASNPGDPHAVTRWIYDVETGAVRDTPDALAVNDTGTTVGIRAAGKDSSGACDDTEVFLEGPDRIRRGLGNPLHGRYGTLACFNRTHDVYLLDEQGRPVVRWESESNVWDTFRWNGKEWDQLPPVGTFIDGITAADDRGDLVGGGGSSEGGIVQHGALWRDGTLVEIGTLGGDVSFARGINDAGQVVGSASATPGPSNEVPFLWSGGVVHALALPPQHTAGEATAISDDGEIGGFAFEPGGLPSSVPMLWVGGLPYDLNDLLETHEWLVVGIAGMTRGGDIVAYGQDLTGRVQPIVLLREGPRAPDRSWRGGGEVLAGNRNPVSLTTDGTRVYWQEFGTVTPSGESRWVLRSVAKAGGAVTELATPRGATPGPLVSDGTSLWFEAAICPDQGCSSVDFAIWQTPVTGGPATRAASGISQFAVQSGLLFSKSLSKDDPLLGTVDRTDLARGSSSAIDTSRLIYNGLGYRVAGGLAADEREVFYTSTDPQGATTIRAQPLLGGPTRDLSASDDRFGLVGALKVEGGFVYASLQHEIVRVRAAGGIPEQIVPKLPESSYVGGMDVSGRTIFWTTYRIFGGQSCLWRANGDGSDATTIECGLRPYGAVRADESSVIVVRGLEIVRFPR